MAMGVSIGDPASVEDHAVVQQSAVAFGNTVESSQEMVRQTHVILVDLTDLLLLFVGTAMVGEFVMSFPYGQVPVASVAARIGEHETANSG
jgi:hypothetical protein